MKLSEFKQIIKEEIDKALNESSSSTKDPETIKSNFNDDVAGFYVVKGGGYGDNEEYWNEDKVKKWILFTTDDNEVDKYRKDGYTIVEITEDGDIDIGAY